MQLLAIASGEGLVRSLLWLLIVGICVGAIYAVGRWFIAKLANPTALLVWNGIFLLLGLLVFVNFLMGLGGHAFIDW